MKHRDRQQLYLKTIQQYQRIIMKVCYIFSSDRLLFDDLYQEICVNIWQGLESFRGDASLSTWIYRTSLNTCITYQRRDRRHHNDIPIDTCGDLVYDSDNDFDYEQYQTLQKLIATLDPFEKAMITLWLDERSYDEISAITGLTKNNVAVKLHRIKNKLIKNGQKL